MEKEYVTVTVEVDADLIAKANKVLEPQGLTVERAFELFLHWMVMHPEEAIALLLKWKSEQEETKA